MSKRAVIYARYSSHNQTEMSIEGQLKECYTYAQREGYTVIKEYIDRALTAAKSIENRLEFQKMIRDSDKRLFDFVIVYQLDRFARNRYDSATQKARLKKNGVRVLSAKENITDDASGILMESVLEGMAEYYSVELSQKIKRGMALRADKRVHIGSHVPFGYSLTEDKHYVIDPVTSVIVKRIFDLYTTDLTLKEIGKKITEEYGHNFGNVFNSLNRILENKMLIGYYNRAGQDIYDPVAVPPIISEELFNRVQLMRAKHKKSPAQARAYEDYILTTKLFCGHDREMMVGTGGTGKSGKTFHYYGCKNAIKKKGCNKKNIKKTLIEDFVVDEARKMLTDENIEMITKAVLDIAKKENNAPVIADLKRKIKECDKAIDNLLKAIEEGEHIKILSDRITKKETERAELEKSLSIKKMSTLALDENEIRFFLYQLKKGDINDVTYRKTLIAIFINAVYLYDDDNRVTIIFNASNAPVTVDYELVNEIESMVNGEISGGERCSYILPTSPFFFWQSL